MICLHDALYRRVWELGPFDSEVEVPHPVIFTNLVSSCQATKRILITSKIAVSRRNEWDVPHFAKTVETRSSPLSGWCNEIFSNLGLSVVYNLEYLVDCSTQNCHNATWSRVYVATFNSCEAWASSMLIAIVICSLRVQSYNCRVISSVSPSHLFQRTKACSMVAELGLTWVESVLIGATVLNTWLPSTRGNSARNFSPFNERNTILSILCESRDYILSAYSLGSLCEEIEFEHAVAIFVSGVSAPSPESLQ